MFYGNGETKFQEMGDFALTAALQKVSAQLVRRGELWIVCVGIKKSDRGLPRVRTAHNKHKRGAGVILSFARALFLSNG
jgi:hypothetical protein